MLQRQLPRPIFIEVGPGGLGILCVQHSHAAQGVSDGYAFERAFLLSRRRTRAQLWSWTPEKKSPVSTRVSGTTPFSALPSCMLGPLRFHSTDQA